MTAQSQILSFEHQGDAVAELHKQLIRVGLPLAAAEVEISLFGASTRIGVLDLQRQLDLPMTGAFDPATRDGLESLVRAGEKVPSQFSVTGLVTDARGAGVAGVHVAAFDRDLRSRQQLGEAITDASGTYGIHYRSSAFRRAEKRRADLIVVVSGRDGDLLAESETVFNARAEAKIDVVVRDSARHDLSEYDTCVRTLTPVLDGLRLRELTESDLEFLAHEVDCSPERLQQLRGAAALANELNIPEPISYAWIRKGLPREVDELLDLDDQLLRSTIEDAVASNRIAPFSAAAMRALFLRVAQLREERGLVGSVEVAGRVVTTSGTGLPLAWVELAFDEHQPAGRVRTGPSGAFQAGVHTRLGAERTTPLVLRVLDRNREVLATAKVGAPSQDIELVVPDAALQRSVPIHEVVERVDLELPADLNARFAELRVTTLEHVRALADDALDGLSDADRAAGATLSAFAELEVLTVDTQTSRVLVEAGFRDLVSIAEAPSPVFVRRTHEALGDFAAAELHARARSQVDALSSLATGVWVDAYNAYPRALQGDLGDWSQTQPQETPKPLLPHHRNCSCKDCEAAVSPTAYLADLIDYATENLRNGTSFVTFSWLDNTFDQRFSSLPNECEQVETAVRQVRIAVEVLRRHLDGKNSSLAADREIGYRLAAYEALLREVGTSRSDLRDALTAGNTVRQRLAERLGVATDAVPGLRLRPGAPTSEPAALTEEALEAVFGLPDTTRDPFSVGAKRGDSSSQIRSWRFPNPRWDKHTDTDGRLHLRIRKQGSDRWYVEAFRDAARTEMVARGWRSSTHGDIRLLQVDQSGLTGEVRLAYVQDSDEVEIVVVPHLLAWRLAELRALWQRLHGFDDPFAEGASSRLPKLHPDIVGPDDMRRPSDGESVYDLWKHRRLYIDGRLEELAGLVTTVHGREVANLQGLLDRMAAPFDYALLAGGQQTVTPFSAATTVDDLFDLHEQLQSSPDAEAVTEQIATQLGLEVDAFTRLVELVRVHEQWVRYAELSPVAAEEWDELRDILLASLERALTATWVAEEDVQAIELGAADFWEPLTRPHTGDLPPRRPAGTPWIDPQRGDTSSLPDPAAGADALQLWTDRSAELDQARDNLEQAWEDNGLDAMLRLAWGDPGPTDPLPAPVADLDALLQAYTSVDPTVSEPAEALVGQHLPMTGDSFRRVMEVRAKIQDPGTYGVPSERDREDLVEILTGAYKRKRLWVAWVSAEQQSGFDSEYWRARKLAMPRWRADAGVRQSWLRALQARAKDPIVDPDRVLWPDFEQPTATNPAYTLYVTRKAWLDAERAAIVANPLDLSGFDTAFASVVGTPASEIEDLKAQEAHGDRIDARLAQLDLNRGAFLRLAALRGVLASNVTLESEEWAEIHDILLQVNKRRHYADWHRAEQAQSIRLGPRYFVLANDDSPELLAWRASRVARRDWVDSLRSRIDQVDGLHGALRDAVDRAEGSTLTGLRDALVQTVPEGGSTLESKAKWVTNTLLIDASMGACLRTTRVAQAIETLQNLLSSTKANFLRDEFPQLALEDDDFHARWEWLGSYTTWRAAMFVFLYPENLLDPSLRRPEVSSRAFRSIVEALRSQRNVAPQQACDLARRYAAYYKDVSELSVEATCTATTRLRFTSCRDHEDEEQIERTLFYMFAQASGSGAVYMSTHDSEEEGPYAQSFWQPLEALEEDVQQIVAAVPYERSPSDRVICLFYVPKQKPNTIALAKYDLNERRFEEDPLELELPDKGGSLRHVLAVQRPEYHYPPTLVIRKGSTKNANPFTYVRSLNEELSGWVGEGGDDEGGGDQDDVDIWASYAPSAGFSEDLVAVVEMRVDYGGYTGEHRKLFFVHGDVTMVDPETLSVGSSWNLKGFHSLTGGIQVGARALGDKKSNHLGVFLYNTSYNHPAPYAIVWLDVTSGTPEWKVFHHMYGMQSVAPHHGPNAIDGISHRVYGVRNQGQIGAGPYRGAYDDVFTSPIEIARERVTPFVEDAGANSPSHLSFSLHANLDSDELQQKRTAEELAFTNNIGLAQEGRSHLVYLEEAYYFVPLLLGLRLQQAGHFEAALAWMRSTYDFSAHPTANRKIYFGLEAEENISMSHAFDRDDAWLLDPLDPHSIAGSRRNAYTRFTLTAIIQCLLDYADTKFTRDTSESVRHARTLYLAAAELLDSADLGIRLGWCDEVIGTLTVEVGKTFGYGFGRIVEALQSGSWGQHAMASAIEGVRAAAMSEGSIDARLDQAMTAVGQARKSDAPGQRLEDVVTHQQTDRRRIVGAAVSHRAAVEVARSSAGTAASHFRRALARATGRDRAQLERAAIPGLRGEGVAGVGPSGAVELGVGGFTKVPGYVVKPKSFDFCVPRNPLRQALALRAETNLAKIRQCRNFAGMRRELEIYSAATDTVTGMPTLSGGGDLVLPSTARLPPTPYRYAALIARAKELVALAEQAESAFLSATERADAERYTRLRAQQDVELARAGVRLQALRVREAKDGVGLARLNRARAEIQRDEYQRWLEGGISQWERATISMLVGAGIFDMVSSAQAAAVTVLAPQAAAMSTQALADALRTTAAVFEMLAQYDRRAQQWGLDKAVAEQDVLIGAQQIRIAEDRVRVVEQERAIAQLESDHASEGLDFLINKFTSAELYDWMSRVLEGTYRFFLQQATSMAQVAAQQLAFERQQIVPPFIRADYWTPPNASLLDEEVVDRRGITGSTRLLQDLVQLDQFAFETDQRKLDLTKTISLARLAPVEFQRFRETGILSFTTPMELFDRDFPGHYLRLIKRVRTSVAALVPTIDGIHAVLRSSGRSQVVLESAGMFAPTSVVNLPQQVALSSPARATGVFDLADHGNQRLRTPFEGMGVEATWEFRLPKPANQFDFRSIADVLITIDYTALDSFEYRQQVTERLGTRFQAERGFRFRHEFADQWFELHNPEQSNTPMKVEFELRASDFPPNVHDVRISHVMAYVAIKGEPVPTTLDLSLHHFADELDTGVGGTAGAVDGLVSTRKGMGAPWMAIGGRSPIGRWRLGFTNNTTVRRLFEEERVEEIVFVVSYRGRTAAWPSG